MEQLLKISRLLNDSIKAEAATTISFFSDQTYADSFLSGAQSIGKIDTAPKPNTLLPPSLIGLPADLAEKTICGTVEAYEKSWFFQKLWWRLTHWDSSIQAYRHLYTIIRLRELNEKFDSIIINSKDAPMNFNTLASLCTSLFDAITEYLCSYLPSHGFFNRFFQEHMMESPYEILLNTILGTTENLMGSAYRTATPLLMGKTSPLKPAH